MGGRASCTRAVCSQTEFELVYRCRRPAGRSERARAGRLREEDEEAGTGGGWWSRRRERRAIGCKGKPRARAWFVSLAFKDARLTALPVSLTVYSRSQAGPRHRTAHLSTAKTGASSPARRRQHGDADSELSRKRQRDTGLRDELLRAQATPAKRRVILPACSLRIEISTASGWKMPPRKEGIRA